jgi:hypothetical protein
MSAFNAVEGVCYMLEKIKYYYETGRWNKAKVKDAVFKGKISETEYKTITGEEYSHEETAN